MSVESSELLQYIENNGDLYKQYESMIKNLVLKKSRGVYNSAKASKLFMYLVKNGAKKYNKENGGTWNTMFSMSDRKHVADTLRDNFEEEYKSGNYDNFLPKYAKGVRKDNPVVESLVAGLATGAGIGAGLFGVKKLIGKKWGKHESNPLVSVAECPKCHRKNGERHLATTKKPSLRTLEKWNEDGVAKATDGCRVEPDGVCQHGHVSWMRIMGLLNPINPGTAWHRDRKVIALKRANDHTISKDSRLIAAGMAEESMVSEAYSKWLESRNNPRGLSVPDKHQLRIARDTLKMSDVGARIMGGPTKAEAREIIKRLTGKTARENPIIHKTAKKAGFPILAIAGIGLAAWYFISKNKQ